MKPVFTFEEIRIVERRIIQDFDFPSLLLMENAGKNAAELIKNAFEDLDEHQIFILCGKGNNAGDGFVAARHLMNSGFELKIIMLDELPHLNGDAKTSFLMLKTAQQDNLIIDFNTFTRSLSPFSKSTKIILVDCILGTGIRGELSAKHREVISKVNLLRKKFPKLKIISVDVPSGLMRGKQINEVIRADRTITMTAMKYELLYGEGKECAGRIDCIDIGVDEKLFEKYNSYDKYIIGHTDIPFIFPKRKKASHKYSNGKVFVIGGSKNLSGAVMMSSLSALKSGCGAVAAAVPSSLMKQFGKELYDVMKVELDENDGTIGADNYSKLEKRIDWADVVLIGPGISVNEQTKEFVISVIQNCSKPLIIDADALNILANDISILEKRKIDNEIILTPHVGEFARLNNVTSELVVNNRLTLLKDFVRKAKVNVVLKSETTISCTKEGKMYFNLAGNEALATAGSGDILSGLIASMFAQTKNSEHAMICGNYLHGKLAENYFIKNKNKQTASPNDLIKLIPESVSNILS